MGRMSLDAGKLLLPLMAAWLCVSTGCESIIGLHDRNYAAAAGSGANAGTGGSASGSAGKGAGTGVTCAKFCTRALAICQDTYSIYNSQAGCESDCSNLSAVDLNCRSDQVTQATSSREFYDYCQGAALGGSKACGGNCENYCALMPKVCTGDNRDPAEVPNCVANCKALVDRETMLTSATQSRFDIQGDLAGDTLQCRLVHLTIAAESGLADQHCWHAAIAPRPFTNGEPNPCATGANETAPHCSDYCHVAMNACTSNNAIYETEAQCNAVCNVLALGSASDEGGDTVGCRKIHAYNALINSADTHCPHAGPGGAGICGDDCPSYCRMYAAGCVDAFKLAYGSSDKAQSTCTAACAAERGDTPVNYSVADATSSSGNPLSCRLLNAARALEHPDQHVNFCESASGAKDCKR